jgi:1-phosphofructokinase family hexose kinase
MPHPLFTLTLNPALDLSGHVPRLIADEKNYVVRPRRDPGGNGINVARVARRFGANAVALGFAGGPTGDEIRDLLAREGVRASFTPIRAHSRVNVTVTNDADHRQTRLTFPGPPVTAGEARALVKRIAKLTRGALLVLGGSAPEGFPSNFYGRLARAAADRGVETIADVPSKLLGPLLNTRGTRLLLIKPNETELEELTGKRVRGARAAANAARVLARRGPALVCVSLGAEGAVLATSTRAWFGAAPRVHARGTVGAGDSMVGAMSVRLLRHGVTAEKVSRGEIPARVFADVLSWGLASGAASAEAEGTAMATVARVRALQRRTGVKELPTS